MDDRGHRSETTALSLGHASLRGFVKGSECGRLFFFQRQGKRVLAAVRRVSFLDGLLGAEPGTQETGWVCTGGEERGGRELRPLAASRAILVSEDMRDSRHLALLATLCAPTRLRKQPPGRSGQAVWFSPDGERLFYEKQGQRRSFF